MARTPIPTYSPSPPPVFPHRFKVRPAGENAFLIVPSSFHLLFASVEEPSQLLCKPNPAEYGTVDRAAPPSEGCRVIVNITWRK